MTGKNNKSVQGTNDSSILSKCSMINLGYFDDPILHNFVGQKKSRRSPLINRGYYIRTKAVQFTLDTFIQQFKQEFQVLSLGAGFDSTYFRLASQKKWPNNSVYYEVDFPEVVQKKEMIIANCPELMRELRIKNDIADKQVLVDSENYKLLALDLRDLKSLKEKLEQVRISFLKPTLVLMECVRTYLDVKSSSNLLKWIAEEFSNVILANYEQLYAHDGFGVVMLNHFSSVGSPLLSIHPEATCRSLNEFYINLGWERTFVTNMSNFYNSLNCEEKTRIEKIEPFDEYEEWHLKCNHYVLIWATKGIVDLKFIPNSSTSVIPIRKRFIWKFINDKNKSVQRFAHSSVLFNSNIISIGGFGVQNGAHKRLKSVIITDTTQQDNNSTEIIKDEILGDRMYAQAVTLNSRSVILVFGGRSSPRNAHGEVVLLTPDKNEQIIVDKIKCNGVNPTPRWRHSASVITVNDVEYVVIFGGKSTETEFLDDCYWLNTQNWTWEKIVENNLPSPRHSHSCTVWKNQIIISGGLGICQQPLKTIHIFDYKTRNWTTLDIPHLLSRYSHTSHMWNDYLFLIGGVNCDPEAFPGVAQINLNTWNCVEYELPVLTREKPVLLHNHTSVLNEETGCISIVGGGGNCFSFGTHFNHDVITLDLNQFIE